MYDIIELNLPEYYYIVCANTSTQPQGKMDASKCDVFSFTILTLYVTTGCPPYEGLNIRLTYTLCRF